MRDVLRHVNEVRKCKDAEHIINIKEKKILVSNSLSEFIIPVLKHLDIENEFSEVYGAEDFGDKGKFISDYIEKNKLDKNLVYYIGDRVADVKLAKNVGVKSIIVSGKCAWNSKQDLIKAQPDFIVGELDDIKEIIRQ